MSYGMGARAAETITVSYSFVVSSAGGILATDSSILRPTGMLRRIETTRVAPSTRALTSSSSVNGQKRISFSCGYLSGAAL